MNLNSFVQEEYHRLYCFEIWWKGMHKLNPEEFPLSFPEDNTGLWEEAFQEYNVDDKVYKL